MVVVSGEPGVGKTALVGEVLKRSRSRGYRILSARTSEFERDLPFAAFVDALEEAVESLLSKDCRLLDEEYLMSLTTVYPSLRCHLARAPRRTEPDERHLVLNALHRLLEFFADERPLVFALDDLQWADPASVDLVCRLLHRGIGGHSLLLLASRPGQSEPRLNAAVADAERHGQAVRFELGPLSFAEAKELLGAEVDPALAESLYSESGGNPFYLEQLAAAGRSLEALPGEEPALVPSWVPWRVGAAIGSELEGLSHLMRVLLQGAAVAGDPFEPELAAETAGLPARDALGDLDELLRRDLIRVTDSPRRFCFRHPIVRRAVYESAGAGWCLQAHGRAAAVLGTQGTPAVTRAHHVERSARVGDVAGAAVLVQAGQELMLRSPSSAAHWFKVGLSLTPEREDTLDLRLGLMAQHAIASGLAGDIEAGRDEAHRFLSLAPPEPGGLRQLVTSMCVGFNLLLGEYPAGRRLLFEAISSLTDQQGHLAAELKYELASSYFFDANWQAMRSHSIESLAADCHGMVRVGSLAVLSLSEFSLSNLNRARRSLAEAVQLFDELTDEQVGAYSAVAIFLAQAEIHAECFADATRHTERAIAVARANGQRLMTIGLLAIQAQALASMGRVPELAAAAEAATETALLSTSDVLLNMAMGVRAFASALAGDLHSALRFAERGARATLGPTSPISWAVRVLLASVLLEMGEPERCREQFISPTGELRLPSAPLLLGLAYELLTAAEASLGHITQAEEFAIRSAESAEQLGTNVPLALAQRARALVSLERGNHHAAITTALRSSEAAKRAGAQVEAARSQTLAGRAMAASGDQAAAISTLQAAHATLLTCGALHYSEQTAKELRKLGRAVPLSSSRGHDQPYILGLTKREHEVMQHVAAGKTNREIAETLFLSARTIDRHLARIFEKLNVHSRAAAASSYTRACEHRVPYERPYDDR